MFGLLLSLSLISLNIALNSKQDLGGTMWSAVGQKPPSTLVIQLPKTEVPGCVHTDWMREGNKTQDLYYRFNDDSLKWIAETNWKYSRTFQTNEAVMDTYEQWLVFEGVDTVAEIRLNGHLLGRTSNMFVIYRFNVSSLLQKNFNLLEVSFQSAVSYASAIAAIQQYTIPPSCPPDVQHGFCHVNLIRKEQCSFSWDWGPAFATQGIWKPVYLLGLNYAVITEATATFDWSKMNLEVDVQFLLVMFADRLPLYGNLSVSIDELKFNKLFNNITLPRSSNELTSKKFTYDFSKVPFKLWWPNGYGSQKLYNISVKFSSSRGNDVSEKHFLFGFRKVELVQETISGSDGLSFYFRINNLPIFAKGANWIPADAFQNRIETETYDQILKSAADVHMNMLRVWGGGIYEDDRFYDTADKLGIMLWQDFMFACALYPTDQQFMANVTAEVTNVMWRLKHHPSIVIWAGNNENEAALATDWYNTTAHFDRYKKDYIDLYVDVLQSEVLAMDISRPFVTSSPSNGKETVAEGGVAKNPYDPHYGDVHYYNYNDDCLDWSKYPATRFASEYGFQSWPSFETIQPITAPEDWSIDSKWADHRQHHATGNQEMLNQISMHFKLPENDNKTQEYIDTIYLTQIMQGLCYKSQTEFYRRSRNETVEGAGHTMGALYWQLNDIWQAPTWSSIEYGGKWKALHYFAASFFSPVALVAYDDDTVLEVYSVSDVAASISGNLIVTIRTWDGFDPCGTFNQSVTISPHKSTKQYEESIGTLLHYGNCPYKEMCYISVHVEGNPMVPVNYFFPVPFKDIDHLHPATFTVVNMTKVGEKEFSLLLETTTPALFVWLQATGLKGRFSDNAFVMGEKTKEVKFYAQYPNVTTEELRAKLHIKSLNELFSTPDDPTQSSSTAPGDEVVWLDHVTIKLVFAIIGFLLIVMAATQVTCLVMRLNTPTSRPKSRINWATNTVVSASGRSRIRTDSGGSSWTPGSSDSHPADDDNDAMSFLIRAKRGSGESAKKTEYRFYII